MSHLNTRRDGKTWWQIAYQGWIRPQYEGDLSGESFSRYLVYIMLYITIVTLCTNVLLFRMCYAVYDGIGETCWC